jgi:hypothetical protein
MKVDSTSSLLASEIEEVFAFETNCEINFPNTRVKPSSKISLREQIEKYEISEFFKGFFEGALEASNSKGLLILLTYLPFKNLLNTGAMGIGASSLLYSALTDWKGTKENIQKFYEEFSSEFLENPKEKIIKLYSKDLYELNKNWETLNTQEKGKFFGLILSKKAASPSKGLNLIQKIFKKPESISQDTLLNKALVDFSKIAQRKIVQIQDKAITKYFLDQFGLQK